MFSVGFWCSTTILGFLYTLISLSTDFALRLFTILYNQIVLILHKSRWSVYASGSIRQSPFATMLRQRMMFRSQKENNTIGREISLHYFHLNLQYLLHCVYLFILLFLNGFWSLLFERCRYHNQYMILYLTCLIICYREKLRDPSSRFLLISCSRNLRKGSNTLVQMKDLCCDIEIGIIFWTSFLTLRVGICVVQKVILVFCFLILLDSIYFDFV